MADEEVLHSPLAVCTTHAMAFSGNDQQIEVLAGLDQGIDQTERRFRWHVGVHLTDDQKQLAAQPICIVDVGTLRILWAQGISHPLLIP